MIQCIEVKARENIVDIVDPATFSFALPPHVTKWVS